MSVEAACEISASLNALPAAQTAFEALFHSYYPRLAARLYWITGDRDKAEEIAAEAFWRLHRKPPSTDTNLEGWLYRTGVRLALDNLKRETRRAHYEALATMIRRGFAAPDKVAEIAEEGEQVRKTLTRLKPRQLALILLQHEGLSYSEIGMALGVPSSSVGTLLSRAQQAFRKKYVQLYGPR